MKMPKANKRILSGALALSIGFALAGCGGMAENRSLYSVNQPVVERTNYTLDLQSGPGGLSVPEQQRLAAWFEAMDLRYGDRVSIEDPMMSGATREAVAEIAKRSGILLSDGAPVTEGFVEPGMSRVVITRSTASVPNCPNWDARSDVNLNNATYPGYGCAINSNIAAMIANPADLISGQTGTGETVVMSSTKAIDSYREKALTGEGALKSAGSSEGGN